MIMRRWKNDGMRVGMKCVGLRDSSLAREDGNAREALGYGWRWMA